VPLYKCTRPDGRDFYTGTVDYGAALASGEPLPELPELPGDDVFPGPGWYHLATVPTECVGMSWPCRLFEVEPVGDVFMDSEHPHKIGCRSVRVLREVPAWRALGPQGEQVVALIERCRRLSAAEMNRLYVARATAWYAAWDGDTAWDAARRDAARRDAARRDAARIAAWRAAVALDAARDAAWVAAVALDVARATAWDAALDAARGAAGDAAGALLLRDLIGQAPGWDQDAYDLLTGPWRQVIGPVHPDDHPEVAS